MAPPVPVRVHDIIIRGNTRTKNAVIESEVGELLRGATTFQELRFAAAVAKDRLRASGIFEFVNVRVDAGRPELPGTANVVIEISEPIKSFAGKLRRFREAAARSYEGRGIRKSLFGLGDIWESLGYCLGLLLPRFEAFRDPWSAGITLYSQDWLTLSSYKDLSLCASLGLLSSGNHHLSYFLSWCSLPVLPLPAYNSFSAWKYSFRSNHSDSRLRPTRGFGFRSSTHIGGAFPDSPLWPSRGYRLLSSPIASLFPDSESLRFINQEVDLRYAIPLGFCGANLGLGVSANVVLQFSFQGFRPSYASGNLSHVAYADLSFDLPVKVLRDAGIRGRVFASTSYANEVTRNAYSGFSLQRLTDSFQHFVGFGVIIPTCLFDMEVNYCHLFRGMTGIQFSFYSRS